MHNFPPFRGSSPIPTLHALQEAYLHRREPFLLYKTNSDSTAALCTVRYREPATTDIWKWGGAPPEVQLTFDQKRGELLGIWYGKVFERMGRSLEWDDGGGGE